MVQISHAGAEGAVAESPAPLLSMRGISKRFPGVVALDQVSLDVNPSEIVALCGENGAGKSTLMKILGGVHQPDAGEIQLAGQTVCINSVNDAMRLGVAFIHQELNVLDNLDVAANIFLGREPRWGGPLQLIDRRRIHADAAPLMNRLGLQVSTSTRLNRLPIAQQQMVEIAKALSLNARLIIMDEPTSSLTLQETDRLLELVVELRKQRVSVVYISHRLAEVNRIADRVVVLRDGKNAGQLGHGEISHDRIVNLMVGREIKNFYVESHAQKTPGYLQVRKARSGRYPKQSVSFDAAQGEILGIAGLVGAGRSEIAQAMVGLDRQGRAEVSIAGRRLQIRRPKDAISHGIYLVPEDRRGTGLVTAMSVRENITLASLDNFSSMLLINRQRERKTTQEQIESLKIKTPGPEALVMNLSGGNQQKVVLGKWLCMSPKVMILDEPTRGIDVGAKAEIYRLMRALADQGAVILMISSDMEEILHVSDRVAVMHEGQITGVLARADCNEQNIMQLAVGRSVAGAQPAFAN
ncbi:MAG TPA: sugar ABC transporter ATP-binding protein [Pirellulales bacterium]|jgi:ribose transport system ATP-binding protein|nr:sugar ABC transporter ATP-binding protein [Pirellulales bacterium]